MKVSVVTLCCLLACGRLLSALPFPLPLSLSPVHTTQASLGDLQAELGSNGTAQLQKARTVGLESPRGAGRSARTKALEGEPGPTWTGSSSKKCLYVENATVLRTTSNALYLQEACARPLRSHVCPQRPTALNPLPVPTLLPIPTQFSPRAPAQAWDSATVLGNGGDGQRPSSLLAQ